MISPKDDWSNRKPLDDVVDPELAKLFRATRPADPGEAAWQAMRGRLL